MDTMELEDIPNVAIKKKSVKFSLEKKDEHVLKTVAEEVGQQVSLAMAKSDQTNALYVLLNFLEHKPEQEPPGGGTALQDGYWTVVQAMQQHDQFLEGMLLKNLDSSSRFPLLHYVVFSTSQENGHFKQNNEWTEMVRQGYGVGQTTHHGAFEEKFSFIDPSLPFLPKRPSNPNAAYIVSAFAACDNEHFPDANWNVWSGADFIVGNIPAELHLQRLTLHKRLATSPMNGIGPRITMSPAAHGLKHERTFSYVLLCELTEGLANVHKTLEFIDKIRDRQCGFTSLYSVDHFF